jgi:hypothetical protein
LDKIPSHIPVHTKKLSRGGGGETLKML